MKNELIKLREKMRQYGTDVYMITMDDEHQSEYVGAHYREIAYISGFTGSAGKLVVTADKAGLFTDGRYFVQAENQLKDSGIDLMRMGDKGTPDISDYISDAMPENGCFGFNGKTVAYSEANALIEKLEAKHVKVKSDKDMAGEVWEGRPEHDYKKIFILDEKYAGESAKSKLARLKEKMRELNADAHVITMLDDIAWTLNLRGDDIKCNPVFLAYLLIDGERTVLYTAKEHLTDEVRAYISELGVELSEDPERIYEDVKSLKGKVLLEEDKTNYELMRCIPSECRIINKLLPTTLMKCVKNKVERENIIKVHIKDGAALTKFMCWFKKNVGKIKMTEMSTAEKLHEFRAQNEGFTDESFTTISAYGANAAMCHYSPSYENDTVIEPKGLYLVDSGGQYYEGTTDVTRTWACGELTEDERLHFTLSVMSMLRLADVRFPEGTCGVALDYAAREEFWRRGLNFNHGTGHGVGYFLNVHERPVGIRYKIVPERLDSYPFYEGMLVSDEPGMYIEGSHGVRTENLILSEKDYENEFGTFLRFRHLTMAPIDITALDTSVMTDNDIRLLNDYHKKVRENLLPYMDEEEKDWLIEATREVEK